jgi:hypothetical protein
MKRIKVATRGRVRPDPGGEQTKEITSPIYFEDRKVIHACESGIIVPGVRLVWTKCDRDVPANAGFTVKGHAIEVTCQKCRAKTAERSSAPLPTCQLERRH